MKFYQFGIILTLVLCANVFAQTPLFEKSSSVAMPSSASTESASEDLSPQDDQYYQLQVLQQEVRSLRGLVEELNYQLQQIKQQQMDDYLDVDRRLSDLANSSFNPTSSGPIANQSSAVTEVAPVTASADGQQTDPSINPVSVDIVDEATMKADYDTASSLLLKNRDLDGAIVAFKSHIDKYPNSAYIPNAYYWLGEIYDLRDQKDLALQSFRIVVDIYTDHSKAMDARFKLGKLYHKMGQDQIAKQMLEAAAQSNGGAAAKARAYLENNPL